MSWYPPCAPLARRALKEKGTTMNFYRQVANRVATPDAQALVDELSEWHDRMVAHVRAPMGSGFSRCDDECAHADARRLWQAVRSVFGEAARELEFLRRHGGGGTPAPPRSASPGPLLDAHP